MTFSNPKRNIDVENYRGIAMQSCIPEILDKFITKLLYDFLGDSITKNQHGFRKGKSTTSNLIEMTQLIHDNSKDRCDLLRLLKSIRSDKARSASRQTLQNHQSKIYTQSGQYRNQLGNWTKKLRSAGPVIYIIFTNDVGLDALCYADDMKLFKIIRNMEDRNILQSNIKKLEQWADANGLMLNPSKTYQVSYGKKLVHWRTKSLKKPQRSAT